MKPSKEAVERAAKAMALAGKKFVGWRKLAEIGLTAAMEPDQFTHAIFQPVDSRRKYGLICLEDE